MLTRLRGAGPGRQAVGHQQRWSVTPGALSPSDPHTVQDGEALPESKGLPGTRGTDVDKAGKGEEVSATCPLAYAARPVSLCQFCLVCSKLRLGNRHRCTVYPSLWPPV